MPSVQELIYTEARRAVEMQGASLDEVRTRTGILLAGAAASASFLGRSVLDDPGTGWAEGFGAVCFIVVGFMAFLILFPWTWKRRTGGGTYSNEHGWYFELNAQKLIDSFRDKGADDLPSTHLTLAKEFADNWGENERRLVGLYKCFETAAGFLAAGIALWLFDLAVY